MKKTRNSCAPRQRHLIKSSRDWEATTEPTKSNQQFDTYWTTFANTVGRRDLPRLDYYFGGYDYRVPSPLIVNENGKLRVHSEIPGFEIRFTTDGSEPNINSSIYKPEQPVNANMRFKTFDTRGRGSKTIDAKQDWDLNDFFDGQD